MHLDTVVQLHDWRGARIKKKGPTIPKVILIYTLIVSLFWVMGWTHTKPMVDLPDTSLYFMGY